MVVLAKARSVASFSSYHRYVAIEVVIEQENRPVAVIKPSRPAGRMIPEVVADLKARESTAVMDDDFARDVEEGIRMNRQPWNPPS